jgi:hypothetical protein
MPAAQEEEQTQARKVEWAEKAGDVWVQVVGVGVETWLPVGNTRRRPWLSTRLGEQTRRLPSWQTWPSGAHRRHLPSMQTWPGGAQTRYPRIAAAALGAVTAREVSEHRTFWVGRRVSVLLLALQTGHASLPSRRGASSLLSL